MARSRDAGLDHETAVNASLILRDARRSAPLGIRHKLAYEA
jgi:hypothetical protein